MTDRSPVVIGGVAGSGTRVYHKLCTLAGYDMGRWCTSPSSGDCLPLIRWFYPRWIDPYLQGRLDAAGLRRMRRACRFWLRLCYPRQSGKWGWKNPRSAYLLPFFDEMFPRMVYIHVVRDGRDQAFNPHFPYLPHQAALLSPEEAALEDPVRKGLHWSRLNRLAESYAEERMQGRYLRSRLEDLCAQPHDEVRRILEFLGGARDEAVEAGAREVRTPGSLGRWREEPRERIARVEQVIGDTLRRYGYELAAAER